MIFAHGPLGYLVARITQKAWGNTSFTEQQTRWLCALGFVAGIFPDIDLFFYYLVDAASSHRALPTHTPIFYAALCAPVYAAARLRNIHWLQSASIIFFFGTMSHLLTDGIFAQVRYLDPFSKDFFGLADVVSETVRNNLLAINFIIEGTIITLFFYALIREYAQRIALRIVLIIALLVTYCAGIGVVYVGNQHLAHVAMPLYYNDSDDDGVIDIQDRDMDGDGVLNIDDTDSDNDGESNPYEVAKIADAFEGVWYDPSNGGFIQIPARLGFLTTIDAPRVLLDNAGVSLRAEMSIDYTQNARGYATGIVDNQFDRNMHNIRTWLEHRGRLQAYEDGRDQIGDILFFENGFIAMVTGFDNSGHAYVLDVSPRREIAQRLVSDVVLNEGKIAERGKILNSAPIK